MFHKELKIELPYHPSVPFLDIYPKEMKTLTRKDTCTSVFIEALFTIGKTWRPPICPVMDEWIKKMDTHTYI